jgi:hypothetical protein
MTNRTQTRIFSHFLNILICTKVLPQKTYDINFMVKYYLNLNTRFSWPIRRNTNCSVTTGVCKGMTCWRQIRTRVTVHASDLPRNVRTVEWRWNAEMCVENNSCKLVHAWLIEMHRFFSCGGWIIHITHTTYVTSAKLCKFTQIRMVLRLRSL